MSADRVGICSWCLDRDSVVNAIERARRELGVGLIQLGFFTAESIERADADAIRGAADANEVSVVGTFVGFDGEDYSSIERIAETGGYTPDECYAGRLALTRRAAELTATLGCHCLAVHPATIPPDLSSTPYRMLVGRVREVADVVAEYDVRLLLETGREPIDTLLALIGQVGCGNIGVNFDAGNFVVYGTDDPVSAARKAGRLIEIVHLKDALRSTRPGVDYGQPAALGVGDAQLPRVLSKLARMGFAGPILLETRASRDDAHGFGGAIRYVRSMLS
ncbi:MAG: sugar phosphate isomerase/epimerase family protein [Phycisphaerae bacterium]|jgi:sugar phosphate isomerase/epimerase